MQININFDKTKAQLKRAWEANPTGCIVAGAAAVTAAAKLMDANSRRKNAQAWKLEVDRRRRKTR